jgi:molybdate transport system substrate-binding protein
VRCSVLALILVAACSSKPAGKSVRIAAAADLARAFEELGKKFEAKTGIAAILTFDSSGLLAKRIDEGAPYALFAAANRDYAQDPVTHGKCDASSMRAYAQGRIVVWTAGGPNSVAGPVQLADLADARFARIAIANPDHAPYGKAAKQALTKAGLWDQLQPKIKYGENIQATMQFAKAGAVDAAIVAQSLAVVTDGGTSLPIDQSLYDPLEQDLVVCGTGTESDYAHQFADYIASPEGREVMTRYGFVVPQ